MSKKNSRLITSFDLPDFNEMIEFDRNQLISVYVESIKLEDEKLKQTFWCFDCCEFYRVICM